MEKSTKTILTIGMGILGGILGMAAPALAEEEKVLNIYNWSDYIGETTIADFEAATGIEVNYDTFDSNEMLETKLLVGGSGYDVVVPASNFLARQVQIGVFQKLNRDALSGLDKLDPALMSMLSLSDPDNAYSIPYTWGTTGIGVNYGMVTERMPDAPIDSWNLMFDPDLLSRFADCGVAVIDSPTQVVATVLNYLGKDPNSEDLDDMAAAMDVLNAIRPHIRHFKTSQVISDLANNEICVLLGWSGDVGQAFLRADEAGTGAELAFSIPFEGAEAFFDLLAIPADAPHPGNAHKFLDFMMKPEVIAEVTNYTYYANANMAASEFVIEDVLNDPGIYPPEDVRAKLFSLQPRSAKYTRALNRAWTKFKAEN